MYCGGKISLEEVGPAIGLPLNMGNARILAKDRAMPVNETQYADNLVNFNQSRQVVRVRMYRTEYCLYRYEGQGNLDNQQNSEILQTASVEGYVFRKLCRLLAEIRSLAMSSTPGLPV